MIRVKKLTDIGEEGFDFFIRQENPTLLNAFSVQTVTEKLNTELERQIEELENRVERGSGWVVGGILKLYLDFSRYNPIRGGYYLPLPKDVQSKNAIINVKTETTSAFVGHLEPHYFQLIKTHKGQANIQPMMALTLQAYHSQRLFMKYRKLKS